jgi:hypothetical protein
MSALTFYGVPGKMTRRLAGVVIGTQGLAVFFGALVARSLAAVNGSNTSNTSIAPNTFLLVGSLLAVVCILDAGLLRRPWGVTVGWVLQLATLATAFVVPAMLPVGLLFSALWLTALVQGSAMDEHTKRVDAQWYAAERSAANEPSANEPSLDEASENRPSPHDG